MPDDFNLRTEIAILKVQMGRLTSDAESEKRTRAATNSDILAQLRGLSADQRKTDKIIWTGLGALILLQFILPFIMPLVFHR